MSQISLTPEQLAALLANSNVQYKHTLSPAAGVGPYSRGNTGLFAVPGLDNNVFSAMTLPEAGLLDALPIRDNTVPFDGDYGGVEQPLYDIITGVTEGASESLANQKEAPCDPAPVGGLLKVGTVTAPYGTFSQGVRPIELVRAAMLQRGNNAENTSLNLVNNPLLSGQNVTPSITAQNPLAQEAQKRIFESAVSWRRYLSRIMWTGNPTNNTAGGGYQEFVGFQTIVNTGKVDFNTLQPLTAADSLVFDFGDNLVDGTVNDIVNYMEQMLENLEYLARNAGFSSVEWRVVMSPNLWRMLTKVWPVRQYQNALTAIAAFGGGRVMVDAKDATSILNDMRANLFLPVNGRVLKVILDDGLPENNSTNSDLPAGQFSSDIYLIPFTANGQTVTYIDPFNYDNANFRFIEQLGFATPHIRVTDGGRFLWASRAQGTCIAIEWQTRFRPVCRTPYLAGRINNVAYQPLQHFRSPYPDSTYFVNGGPTNTQQITGYTEWGGNSKVVIGG